MHLKIDVHVIREKPLMPQEYKETQEKDHLEEKITRDMNIQACTLLKIF